MKKFIIVMAAVAMASVATAANVNWNVTGIYEPDTTTKAAGYIAYLFDTAVVSDKAAVESAIKGGTFGTYASQATSNGTSNDNGVIMKTGAVTGKAAGTYYYYTILFDASSASNAKHYIITENKTVTLGDSGAGAAAFASISGKAGENWQNVPEPTSAMLLLLGVAGLALKRKQK